MSVAAGQFFSFSWRVQAEDSRRQSRVINR
jgi:hypothetical protein